MHTELFGSCGQKSLNEQSLSVSRHKAMEQMLQITEPTKSFWGHQLALLFVSLCIFVSLRAFVTLASVFVFCRLVFCVVVAGGGGQGQNSPPPLTFRRHWPCNELGEVEHLPRSHSLLNANVNGARVNSDL